MERSRKDGMKEQDGMEKRKDDTERRKEEERMAKAVKVKGRP